MKKTMFALFGKKDSGKSSTIAYVLDDLRKHASGNPNVQLGRQRQGGLPPEVWWAVLTINGVLVGITSPGDKEEQIRKHVQRLIDAGCQVILCAIRASLTRRSSCRTALQELADSAVPPYKIEPIPKKWSCLRDAETCNRRQCGEIVRKVLEAVGVHQEAVEAELVEA